jgi:hypothetical protein
VTCQDVTTAREWFRIKRWSVKEPVCDALAAWIPSRRATDILVRIAGFKPSCFSADCPSPAPYELPKGRQSSLVYAHPGIIVWWDASIFHWSNIYTSSCQPLWIQESTSCANESAHAGDSLPSPNFNSQQLEGRFRALTPISLASLRFG